MASILLDRSVIATPSFKWRWMYRTVMSKGRNLLLASLMRLVAAKSFSLRQRSNNSVSLMLASTTASAKYWSDSVQLPVVSAIRKSWVCMRLSMERRLAGNLVCSV